MKGFSQVEGSNFDQIFSLVMHFETVQLMLGLAALKDWYIFGLYIKSTYLYGELDKEIYMKQPEGFKIPRQGNKVLHLWCILYRLKQAGLAWWWTLNESMRELGFKHLKSDTRIFLFKRKGFQIVVAIMYVDNALFYDPNKAIVDEVKYAENSFNNIVCWGMSQVE